MAVAQQGSTVTGTANATTGTSSSFTISTGAGSLGLLVFTYHEAAGGAVSSVTWNGGAQALTKIDSQSGSSFSHVECWKLVNPTTATNTVSIVKASAASNQFGWAIYVLEGCDQTTFNRTAAKATAASGTSASVTVGSVASGDLTIDGLSIDAGGHLPVAGANQTASHTVLAPGGGTNGIGSTQTTTDGQMSWTWTTSGVNSLLAVAVIAAGGGGGGTTQQELALLGVGS
jgi:hypothetical protein